MKKLLITTLLSLPILAISQVKKDTAYRAFGGVDTVSATSTRNVSITNSYTFPEYYTINWDSVKTLEDVKLILEALQITVYGNSPQYNKLKKYLILAK